MSSETSLIEHERFSLTRPPGRRFFRNSSVSEIQSFGVASKARERSGRRDRPSSTTSSRSRRVSSPASTSRPSLEFVTTNWPDLPLLADTSAWVRASHESVRAAWAQAVGEGRIVTCQPVALELLYSTRDVAAFDDLAAALDALRTLSLTEGIARAARTAMRDLAATRPLSHRLPPLDYLVAALAQEAGVAVLHYDEHFDRLATVLTFESVWLASPGSLA